MSVDLGSILSGVAGIAASVVTTSGTQVQIIRDTDGTADVTVDPTTLAVTDPTPGTSGATVPALVVQAGAAGQPAGPYRTIETGAYRVLLLPTADVKQGDVLRVTVSRDPALVNARLSVQNVGADSAGLLRQVDAVAL